MENSISRSPKDHSSADSYEITTPPYQSYNPRGGYGGKGRMALDLLLNDDSVVSGGKREDEWVGENAAPALIVSRVSTCFVLGG